MEVFSSWYKFMCNQLVFLKHLRCVRSSGKNKKNPFTSGKIKQASESHLAIMSDFHNELIAVAKSTALDNVAFCMQLYLY